MFLEGTEQVSHTVGFCSAKLIGGVGMRRSSVLMKCLDHQPNFSR